MDSHLIDKKLECMRIENRRAKATKSQKSIQRFSMLIIIKIFFNQIKDDVCKEALSTLFKY